MKGLRRHRPPWRADRRTGRFAGPPWPDDPGGPSRPGGHKPKGVPVLAAALFHVIGASRAAAHGEVFLTMSPPVYALLLVGPLALMWRDRRPVLAFGVAAAASIGFATFAEPRWFWSVAPVIALWHLARIGRRRAAVISALVAYAGYLVVCDVLATPLGLYPQVRPELREMLVLGAMLAVTIFLGNGARSRAQHLAEIMRARAERERAEEEQQRRQASEERLRIARELHDVIGHHLSLINVQAGVGLHLMDNRPEQAREALTAIKTASAEALREVRTVLGALRTEGEAAPRQPALGLSRLDDLTAGAGLPVSTEVTGEVRTLPAEVDRAAYRIVQEALTNVRRHAGPGATASIAVDYLPTALHLAIRNDTGAPVEGRRETPGTGIAGMRARAQSLGGTLEAGPVEGGYLVSVLLPAAIDDADGSRATVLPTTGNDHGGAGG